MANKNVFAIAGIGIFLLVGAVVAVGILGTIGLILYAIAGVVFRNVFGIELPHLF